MTSMYTASYAEASFVIEPGSQASLASRAHADLERMLLSGEFPIGNRLGEERLAALLDVSRTPIREALLRLGEAGLVERHPEGGWKPVAPDLAQVRELYEVRRGLELQALLRPTETRSAHDRSALEALHAAWQRLADHKPEPTPDFVIMDETFHIGIARAAGNMVFVEMLTMVNQRIRAVRMHDFLTTERIHTTIDEHLGILEALLNADLPIASMRLRNHVYTSLAIVEERAARALARMLSPRRGAPGSLGA